MAATPEPFEIAYYGVTIEATPVINGADMRYEIDLPTREVIIETAFDENALSYWIEVPGGSEEIGFIIESQEK